MVALLLALVGGIFPASPFGERDVAYAQTQDDNRLQSLSITGVSLSPSFNRDTDTYSARVPNATTSVVVRATTSNRNATVAIGTEPAETGTSTQTIPISSEGANNEITVTVDPLDENTANGVYTINVYRDADVRSNVNTLGSLAVRAGADDTSGTDLIAAFEAETDKYDVRVGHNIETVTLAASATNVGAVVQVGNVRYNQNITSRNIDLNGKGSKTDIRLTVTPEDGSGSESYAVTVYRERATLSSDNNLRNLSLGSGINLMPSFSSSETKYTARVPNNIDHATVTSTLSDQAGGAEAARTVPDPSEGETPDSRDASGDQVELAAGAETTITVMVTAEDGSAKDYTVDVYRENYEKSDDQTLSALTVHQGNATTGTEVTLTPSLSEDANASMRTGSVPNTVSSVTVAATATDTGAMRSITPADASGSMGHQVNLIAGAQTSITVTVTAEDGSAKDYTIKVYRSAPIASKDNTLKSLTVTGLNGAGGSTTEIFTPAIPRLVENAATINIRVRNVTSNVRIEATGHPSATVTFTAENAVAAGDATNIVVTVDPESDDNVENGTYTIRVYRENETRSDVKTLGVLTVHAGTDTNVTALALTPAFEADDNASMSTLTVGNTVSSVTVTATATHTGAMRSITPADASGSMGHQVNLTAGAETTITVTVTAEDGSTTDYTIEVFRMRGLVSDNATLGSLTVTDASGEAQALDPEFAPSETSYKVRVANSVDVVNIAAETAVVGATLDISSVPDDDPSTPGMQVFLSAGVSRTFSVTVSAENHDPDTTPPVTNEKTYMITLYRERATLSDNANLASAGGLTLSPGALIPPYSSSKTDYRVVVGNGVSNVGVAASAADAGAEVDIMPTDADSNVTGHQVSVIAGAETSITATVTAEDGSTTKTYTVVVYRERAPKSNDAMLSVLTLGGAILSPEFASDVMTYTARAGYSSDEVTLSYTPDIGAMSIAVQGGRPSSTLSPVSMSRSGATVRLYTTGETQIEITVTAEDGATMKYTITVSRESEPSSDASLSSLMLSGVTLMPEFASDTTAYTAMVESDVAMTTVTAMAAHPGATVAGTGEMALAAGENVINVMVTAEDESTQTYTVTVTVAPPVEGDLLGRYDADDSGDIDLDEVSAAIDDYFNGDLTLAQVSDVIDLYFG